MSESSLKFSVIVPTYQPGEGIARVLGSLDRQTLPADQFEILVVDDGSPDNTYQRLQHEAASRPTMSVERIENSGWPSRPRNTALEKARGEYVLFMDHDDSLFPDALRGAWEFASSCHADLISPKESKTTDVWWGMSSLTEGDRTDLKQRKDILGLLPMVPHKLYRREFLMEHGIRFPEGRRMLWEDIYVNAWAYAKADVVASLASVPFYVWHSSTSNNSKTYGPRDDEFWDRLEDLLSFLETTLADCPVERRDLLLFQYRSRVLDRLARNLQKMEPEQRDAAVARALAVRHAHIPDEWVDHLPLRHRRLSHLLDSGRTDLMPLMDSTDKSLRVNGVAHTVKWGTGERAGVLSMAVSLDLDTAGGPAFTQDEHGLCMRVPPALAEALPRELLAADDVVDELEQILVVRIRGGWLTWQLPLKDETRELRDAGNGGLVPRISGRAVLDLAHGAFGKPIEGDVLDAYCRLSWDGVVRTRRLAYRHKAEQCVWNDQFRIAYRNTHGFLSVDNAQALRTPLKDGRIKIGSPAGTAHQLRIPLRIPHDAGSTAEVGPVFAIVEGSWGERLRGRLGMNPQREARARRRGERIDLTLRTDDSQAWVEGAAHLAGGAPYVLYQERTTGELSRLPWGLRVDQGGARVGGRHSRTDALTSPSLSVQTRQRPASSSASSHNQPAARVNRR